MSQLQEMQSRLLEMLKFFHEFCVSNELKYFTIGGTALGAIRHNGFIPWDDDIDIGLPRSDYERLITIFGNSIIDKFVLESSKSENDEFCYTYAKLYDTTTTLIENTKQPIKRGIYIDIFPLDGVGNSEQEAKKQFSLIDKKKKIISLRTIKINKSRKFYKNLLLRCVQALPSFIVNEKRVINQIEVLCRQKDYYDCTFVGNLNGAWGWKEIMPKSFFGTPTLHQFETIMVYVPEKYDDYLTHVYGDWRRLPPKEKQISHHDHFLDLSKSYLDQ